MDQKKISRKLILEFYQDIIRWKSMLGYASNELVFLDKLLRAKAFEDTIWIKTEEMVGFKLVLKTKKREIKKLTTQIELSKNNVQAFLECDETSSVQFSFENYKELKQNFVSFNTSYNEYKTEIFEHTGGIL